MYLGPRPKDSPMTLEYISEQEVRTATQTVVVYVYPAITNSEYLGVCCPGGVTKALELEEWEWNRIFSSGHACGSSEIAIIHDRPTGYVH